MADFKFLNGGGGGGGGVGVVTVILKFKQLRVQQLQNIEIK